MEFTFFEIWADGAVNLMADNFVSAGAEPVPLFNLGGAVPQFPVWILTALLAAHASHYLLEKPLLGLRARFREG
jgi:hypothetical protein